MNKHTLETVNRYDRWDFQVIYAKRYESFTIAQYYLIANKLFIKYVYISVCKCSVHASAVTSHDKVIREAVTADDRWHQPSVAGTIGAIMGCDYKDSLPSICGLRHECNTNANSELISTSDLKQTAGTLQRDRAPHRAKRLYRPLPHIIQVLQPITFWNILRRICLINRLTRTENWSIYW